MAKLDEAKVTDIRRAYWCDGVSMGKLGKRYGVTRETIRAIVNGET